MAAHFFKGIGDGGFAAPLALPISGTWASSIVAGSFVDAGVVDFVAAVEEGSWLNVFLGNGLGEFVAGPTLSWPYLPLTVAVGDFNGDGSPDVAGGGGWPDGLSVFLNWSGSFGFGTMYAQGLEIRAMAFSDLDGDGTSELLAVSDARLGSDGSENAEYRLNIFWHTADGTVVTSTVSTGMAPLSVISSDLNGDGAPDVIVGNQDDSVNVFINACP
jgi:hypothetical protein